MGFHIGWVERIAVVNFVSTTEDLPSVNGCSMKTEANLAAIKAIPPGKIMFETGKSILIGDLFTF